MSDKPWKREGKSYRRQEGEYMLSIDWVMYGATKDWDARIEVYTESGDAPREVWSRTSYVTLAAAKKAADSAIKAKPWERQ